MRYLYIVSIQIYKASLLLIKKYTFEGLDLEIKKKSQSGECFVTSNVPLVYADKSGIERVIINILDNAIKFSYENTKIVIKNKKIRD